MSLDSSWNGIKETKVYTEEQLEQPSYKKMLESAQSYLEGNNKPLADILSGLTDDQKYTLYLDMGGSFYDLLGDTSDIDAVRQSFDEYVSYMPTAGDYYEILNEKTGKRMKIIKDIKSQIEL